MPPSTCWPGEDLDGFKEISPAGPVFMFHWNAEILDTSGVPAEEILKVSDDFDVRFRIEFGPGWTCMSGDWHLDMLFESVGEGDEFALSDRLPGGALVVAGWKGCDQPDQLCIEHRYTVPAGTVEAGVYIVTAVIRLWCCDRPVPVTGFDPLGQRQWY